MDLWNVDDLYKKIYFTIFQDSEDIDVIQESEELLPGSTSDTQDDREGCDDGEDMLVLLIITYLF